MKFNFKKIASVLTGAVMLSSTMAFAAAAALPDPFVKSGAGDYAVVTGTGVATSDNTAALDINAYLAAKVTTVEPTPVANVTLSGEVFSLSKSNDRINLGEALNEVYSTNLDADKLPNVLAAGVYADKGGNDDKYKQKVLLGSSTITHFVDNDVNDDKPVLGFDMADGTLVLSYTLSFTDKPAIADMNDTNINILGKEYYVSKVTKTTIDLLDKANTATVDEDTPVTVTVGDKTYEVSIASVDGTAEKATLIVNGKKLDSISLGNSKKIAENTWLSVTDLKEGTRERDKSWVEFNVGAGKIVLTNNENVEINEETNDALKAQIVPATNDMSEVIINWTTDEEKFLVPGSEMVMPGFGGVKLSMPSFVTAKPETLSVKNSGTTYMQIQDLQVTDGDIGALPILYTNSTKTGFGGIGKDADNELATANAGTLTLTLDEDKNTRFAVSWISNDNWESYVFETVSVNKANDQNETKIKNLADNKEYTFTTSDAEEDTNDFGNVQLGIVGSGEAGTAALTVTALGGGTAYLDRIVTAEGLQMMLPVTSAVALPNGNHLNTTANINQSTWKMNFREADQDNNVGTGASFNVTLGHTTANGPQVASILVPGASGATGGLQIDSGSDDYEAYVGGDESHATKLLFKTGGDQDTVDITYHGSEAYADVYLAEAAATSSSGGGSAGSLVVTDAEVATVSSKNLIVVGGSCVNTVARRLIDSTATAPVCGTDWTAKTSVGAGSFLIQTFESPYAATKVATLVAGYDAADTTNAANAFKTDTTVQAVKGNKFVGRAGQALQLTTV